MIRITHAKTSKKSVERITYNLYLKIPEIPIIGFKNNKNLKSHLVRAALLDMC